MIKAIPMWEINKILLCFNGSYTFELSNGNKYLVIDNAVIHVSIDDGKTLFKSIESAISTYEKTESGFQCDKKDGLFND